MLSLTQVFTCRYFIYGYKFLHARPNPITSPFLSKGEKFRKITKETNNEDLYTQNSGIEDVEILHQKF